MINEPDKLNMDVVEIFLNLINERINRIQEDYMLPTNDMEIAVLNSYNATQLIQGDDPDKVKISKYIIQMNTIGCQICLDDLKRNPKITLKPQLVISEKRKSKILLTWGMQNCPNLFSCSIPKKRMKKVRRSNICKFCMQVNQNCT